MLARRLPPEILQQVLRFAGSTFFRQNTARLTISKWWYQLAWPVLLQDLDFRPESLERFILASKSQENLVAAVRKHAVTASLGLYDYEEWHRARPEFEVVEPADADRGVADRWTIEMDECIAVLASILSSAPRLRCVEVVARRQPLLNWARRDYLLPQPLASLALGSLTRLEIDTAGTIFFDEVGSPGQYANDPSHVCASISLLLPTLQRLRCRMSRICPAILRLPRDHGDDSRLRLEHVVINLSLSNTGDQTTSYRYPHRCEDIYGDTFPDLKADMESCATELARRRETKSQCVIRIVSHTFPGLEMQSFDALTGRRMRIDPAAPWDADGDVVEEVVLEQDLFDSDSSSEEFVI